MRSTTILTAVLSAVIFTSVALSATYMVVNSKSGNASNNMSLHPSDAGSNSQAMAGTAVLSH